MEGVNRSMICANSDCGQEFSAKTHNQKYCSDECCRIATNRRIMEKYYEKKAIRNGALRHCKCGGELSRYSESKICSMCIDKEKRETRKRLRDMLNGVS
jgi:hypothetical protein